MNASREDRAGYQRAAAFISRGQCSEVFTRCAHRHELISSRPILEDYREKLVHKFGIATWLAAADTHLIEFGMQAVEPAKLPEPVCRDPGDDVILGTAVAGGCDCIVTGDKDLLVLQHYEHIDILRPADFWAYEAARDPGPSSSE